MAKTFTMAQFPNAFCFAAPKDPRCGTCTVCCTALGVPELEKKPRVACVHDSGKNCSIYKTRPQSCQDYVCLWLQGAMPTYARPDRFGVLFDAHPDGTAVLARETEPGAFERAEVQNLMRRFSNRLVLYCMNGDRRRVLGPPELVSAFMDRYEAQLSKDVPNGPVDT